AVLRAPQQHRGGLMRRMTLITAGVLAIGSLAAASGTALAQDDAGDDATDSTDAEAPVPAATSTTTLPLLGAGLTVDVTTDAGGGLLEVGLDSPDDFIATGIRSNKVAFTNETDGVDVKVSTRWGGERVE